MKLTTYGRIGHATTASLVVLSATVTFLGFAGPDRLVTYARWIDADVSPARTEFWFNILLLLVVVLVILDQVYRFGERAHDHNHAVVMLANFVNRLDDEIAGLVSADDEKALLEVTAARYEVMTEFLPPNTDRQYHRSKKLDPKPANDDRRPPSDSWTDEGRCRTALTEIILADASRAELLRAVRDVMPAALIAGGLVRAAVWDSLSGRSVATPVDDVDVIFFDSSAEEGAEVEWEDQLRKVIPNVPWQVKNQARARDAVSGTPASLEESLSRAPETVSSVGVRLDVDDNLVVCAPNGVSDLFRMVVRPRIGATQYELDRFRKRAAQKHWSSEWPAVVVTTPS